MQLIYIGIFGKCHSIPSVNEFNIARATQIPTFIFLRRLRSNETRESELTKFIDDIKDPKTGIGYNEFENVLDLTDKIKKR